MRTNETHEKEVPVSDTLDTTEFLGPNHADQEALAYFKETAGPSAVSFYL